MAQRQDAVAQKIHSILRPLLAIENNSFNGGCYHVCASSEIDKQESQCLGNTNEVFHSLRIQIPYFGTIQIEHRPVFCGDEEQAERRLLNTSVSRETRNNIVVHCQPVDNENFPVNTDSYSVLSDPGMTSHHEPESANWNQESLPLSFSGAQETCLLVPGLEAGVDDWALQGVDMALFNNFTQGPV
jgi:hypothetical protein